MGGDVRLLSFLGTGDYKSTCYVVSAAAEPVETETCYVALALARALGANDTVLLATAAAEEKHGSALRSGFTAAGLAAPRVVRLRDGSSTDELWANFRTLSDEVRRPGAAHQVLDITHGFRSQPFFAAAVASFARAVGDAHADVSIVYGAFDARYADNRTPVWDLTPFMELLDWSHAIRAFADSGDAKAISRLVRPVAREAGRHWFLGGRQGERPRLEQFARALEQFSEALLSLRTGELLLCQDRGPSAAARLLDACRQAREDLGRHIPPLAEVVGEIEAIAAPLTCEADDLTGEEGKRLMAALAERYLHFGRLAEAAVTLREGWVNLHAPREAARPGFSDYVEAARSRAERQWIAASPHHRAIADLRNDIEHGGFRARPLPAQTVRERLGQFVRDLEAAPLPAPSPSVAGRTWFVSRHPGAVEWARRKGHCVERHVAHLDVGQVAAGDTVIGTLPVHIAAEVCRRGARYLNLSLDLTESARGRELDADELELFGARLQEFSIQTME